MTDRCVGCLSPQDMLRDTDANVRFAGALLAVRAHNASCLPAALRVDLPAGHSGAETVLLGALSAAAYDLVPSLSEAIARGRADPGSVESTRALKALVTLNSGSAVSSADLAAVVEALMAPHRLDDARLQEAVESRRLLACQVLSAPAFFAALSRSDQFGLRVKAIETLLMWLTGEPKGARPAAELLLGLGRLAVALIRRAAEQPERVVAEAGWGADHGRTDRLRNNLAMLCYSLALDARASARRALAEDGRQQLVQAAAALAAEPGSGEERSRTAGFAVMALNAAGAATGASAQKVLKAWPYLDAGARMLAVQWLAASARLPEVNQALIAGQVPEHPGLQGALLARGWAAIAHDAEEAGGPVARAAAHLSSPDAATAACAAFAVGALGRVGCSYHQLLSKLTQRHEESGWYLWFYAAANAVYTGDAGGLRRLFLDMAPQTRGPLVVVLVRGQKAHDEAAAAH